MLDLKYSSILKMAIPLMVSSFIQSVVLITDSSFISRYSTDAFDAVGNGGLIYITFFMALVGMSDGAQIIIARRIGQKNTDAIGRVFGTSVFSHFFLAIALFLFLQFVMPNFLNSYSKHADISLLQGEYIRIRSFALFFAMISLAINAFFLANGKTWVVLIAALITATSNVILDYLMIFGKGGFPEMGLQGAAWASTLADLSGMIFLSIFLIFSKERKQYQLFSHFSFNLASMKELFKIGSPLMFQGFLALATWTIFFTWLEQTGKFELTVSQNVRSIYFLAFVPIWGFAGTTKTYISQYIGRGDLHSLKIIQRRIQFLTMIFLFLFFHGAVFYPEKLIEMINPEQAYIQKSAEILRYISISIFMYGIFSVYFQTINGSGNTMASFMIEILCAIVYLLSSFLLIKVLQVDVLWIWTNEYIYFGTMGILSMLYLKFFDWKKKVV
ncbi:MAG: MATE family efflux transporter [Crocinitomicaceae bacterium]|nr:MATE family efflux transporter [Crocinitomicaceae bacterium]MDP4798142.1 MATE family efflux transporter [Crocinitomicaceae bacterium]